MMTEDELKATVAERLFPAWAKEREKLNRIDQWARWDHEEPHRPRHATTEYRELAARAQAPWGDLIVSSIAQTLYVEGYRRPDAPEDSSGWSIWQANGMDGRQVALHRAVLTYGLAYATCLPGKTLAGDPMPILRGVSPREMLALYDDPANDDWAEVAIRVAVIPGKGYRVTVFDDEYRYELTMGGDTSVPALVSAFEHGTGVCPVVRYKNRFDLEGRSAGEIEPFIPVLGKIDQTSFDRLVVQRFASWIVRTIAGMSVVESAEATDSTPEAVKMRLRVEDMLTAEDPDTKFGSLPATPLEGFIKAHDADVTTLAAVSQTPAFEMLGQMANLSAEALEAAKDSQTAKSDERKHTLGEDHEQLIRLAAHVAGDTDGASDFAAQVRWADTSIRSLSQSADAFGKLVTMLGMPPEVLWPKIPGFTQQDVDEARLIVDRVGGMDALLAQLVAGQTSPELTSPA